MGNYGRVASTSDTTHGHLSDCDDRGDAVGRFGFAPVEAVVLQRSFHQHGDAEVDVFIAEFGIAGAVAHADV